MGRRTWCNPCFLTSTSSSLLFSFQECCNGVPLHWYFYSPGGDPALPLLSLRPLLLVCFVWSGQKGPRSPLLHISFVNSPPPCLSPTVYQLVKLNAECLCLAQSPHSPAHWLSPWQQAHLMEAVFYLATESWGREGCRGGAAESLTVLLWKAEQKERISYWNWKWPITPRWLAELHRAPLAIRMHHADVTLTLFSLHSGSSRHTSSKSLNFSWPLCLP